VNLTLERLYVGQYGAFGELLDGFGRTICFTLEHAYQDGADWSAKVPAGAYLCQRGEHQLTSGEVFETFEIMNVPGHSGILFHCGNVEDDSAGCVLVGQGISNFALVNSRIAFDAFLQATAGVDSFQLTVK
jgi:hypothetical protein